MGYEFLYENSVDFGNTTDKILRLDKKYISSIKGEFLFVCLNKVTGIIFIVTDRTGSFPCYFATYEESLFLSTSFGNVKEKLHNPTLNMNQAIEYIANSLLITRETIVNEIEKIPPGHIICFNLKDNERSITNYDEELTRKAIQTRELPLERFLDELLIILSTEIKDRLSYLDQFEVGTGLSAGLDSTLISCLLHEQMGGDLTCYTLRALFALLLDDPTIIDRFVKKHGLRHKFIKISPTASAPLSQPRDRSATAENAIQWTPLRELNDCFFREISDDGVQVLFTGDHGDEFYRLHAQNIIGDYFLHENYFTMVQHLERGLDLVLTNAGIKYLTDSARFMNRDFYRTAVAPSTLNVNDGLFQCYWENNLWPIQPFASRRLLDFGKSVRIADNPSDKRDILKPLEGKYYVQEQLSKRTDNLSANSFIALLFPYSKSLILNLLQSAELGKMGLVNSSQICEDISAGRIEKYTHGDEIIYIHNLLRIEYFLQHNQVDTIPADLFRLPLN